MWEVNLRQLWRGPKETMAIDSSGVVREGVARSENVQGRVLEFGRHRTGVGKAKEGELSAACRKVRERELHQKLGGDANK